MTTERIRELGKIERTGKIGGLMELEGTKMLLKTTGHSSILLPQKVLESVTSWMRQELICMGKHI